MPVVVLPDGTHVTLPDTPAPAPASGVPGWVQDLVKYGPGFLKEGGKSLLRGFATMAADLGEGASALAGEGMRNGNITNSPKPQEEIRAAVPNNLPDTPAGKRFNRMMEGAGGGAVVPIGGPVVAAAQGAMGGLGGETARQGAEQFFPNSPNLQAGADILGSLFGGAATGFALGPKQSVAQQDIRKAFTGTTAQDFDQAAANAAAAQNAGAKTATGAEMFGPNTGVVALAKNARASSADNALRQKTANRPDDLKQLSQEFLDRITPYEVDPGQVANVAGEAANAALASSKSLRSTAISNRFAGQDVPFSGVDQLVSDLRKMATAQSRTSAGNAYREVANALLDQTQQPMTDLQQISLSLRSLKDAPKNPNNPLFSGGQINTVDLAKALDVANQRLGQLNPVANQAIDEFQKFSRGPMAAERVGPIGNLADRNPLLDNPTGIPKLEGLVSKNSPSTIEGTARTLSNPMMTGKFGPAGIEPGPTVNPQDIARAIAQQKLRTNMTNPGPAIRGDAGSMADRQFQALLDAAGMNTPEVMAPLGVADNLQTLAKPANLNEGTRMQWRQLLIRPFRTVDMMMTGSSLGKVNSEVAQLLADGSPQSIRRLQEIAMFDPNLRRILTAKALIPPVTGQGQ